MKRLCRGIAAVAISMSIVGGVAGAAVQSQSLWDYSIMMEVRIDRPIHDVWPYFFGDKKGVWSNTQYTTVAGEPDREGEVYTQTHHENGVYSGADFFYKAIKIHPESQLILKITYKDNGSAEEKLAGYDFITLSEKAGHTTVALQQAFAIPVEVSKDGLKAETEKQTKMLTDIFNTLKHMVETEKSATRGADRQ